MKDLKETKVRSFRLSKEISDELDELKLDSSWDELFKELMGEKQ